MILHPMSGESSINQISDLHNYMINSKVDSKLKESSCQKSNRLPKRKEIFSQMVFFSQNTRNCCFSFYKNSIKPSTYSVRIFTKDLELQLSKKCTNRIYYFSVSLSTSSSSFLFILYFFLFFAYLHFF